MASTHIHIRCRNCGYSHSSSVYGYVGDPIGIPFVRCPCCDTVFRDSTHKEWIQCSMIKKYFSISPRGNILAFLLAFIPLVAVSKATGFAIAQNMITLLFWLFLFWLVIDYAIICFRANTSRFLDRIVPSIARTRDESYRNALSNLGKTYDENLPPFVIFTATSKATLERRVTIAETLDYKIPTFKDSIRNC